jgi:cytochrome P450
MNANPLPPGPRGSLLLGNALDYRRDPIGFVAGLASDYGSVASFRLGPQRLCLLTDPGDIERVLLREARGFEKPALITRMGRLLFGEALTARDGEAWARQRRLAMPAFRRDVQGVAAALAGRELAAEVGRLRGIDPRSLDDELFKLLLGAYARVLFGAAPPELTPIAAAMRTALRGFAARVQRGLALPDWLPLRDNRDMRRGMRAVRACVARVLADAPRRDPASVAALLRAAHDANAAGYAEPTLVDELAVMWALGAHQSATALAWALHAAATHPVDAARLADAAPEGGGDAPPPPFAAAFVDEVLRLFPPFPAIVRRALHPFDAGGYAIERGTVLMISLWVTHRDARHFVDPLAFRPERWSDGLRRALPQGAYLPFGLGPRACIAGALAREVVAGALIEIVRRFRLVAPAEAVAEPAPGVTASIRGGLRLALEPRERRAA